jgi:hypothetical protein
MWFSGFSWHSFVTPRCFPWLLQDMYTCKLHMQILHYFITDATVDLVPNNLNVVSKKKYLIGIQQEFIWNNLKSSASIGCAISYNMIVLICNMYLVSIPLYCSRCAPTTTYALFTSPRHNVTVKTYFLFISYYIYW